MRYIAPCLQVGQSGAPPPLPPPGTPPLQFLVSSPSLPRKKLEQFHLCFVFPPDPCLLSTISDFVSHSLPDFFSAMGPSSPPRLPWPLFNALVLLNRGPSFPKDSTAPGVVFAALFPEHPPPFQEIVSHQSLTAVPTPRIAKNSIFFCRIHISSLVFPSSYSSLIITPAIFQPSSGPATLLSDPLAKSP